MCGSWLPWKLQVGMDWSDTGGIGFKWGCVAGTGSSQVRNPCSWLHMWRTRRVWGQTHRHLGVAWGGAHRHWDIARGETHRHWRGGTHRHWSGAKPTKAFGETKLTGILGIRGERITVPLSEAKLTNGAAVTWAKPRTRQLSSIAVTGRNQDISSATNSKLNYRVFGLARKTPFYTTHCKQVCPRGYGVYLHVEYYIHDILIARYQ